MIPALVGAAVVTTIALAALHARRRRARAWLEVGRRLGLTQRDAPNHDELEGSLEGVPVTLRRLGDHGCVLTVPITPPLGPGLTFSTCAAPSAIASSSLPLELAALHCAARAIDPDAARALLAHASAAIAQHAREDVHVTDDAVRIVVRGEPSDVRFVHAARIAKHLADVLVVAARAVRARSWRETMLERWLAQGVAIESADGLLLTGRHGARAFVIELPAAAVPSDLVVRVELALPVPLTATLLRAGDVEVTLRAAAGDRVAELGVPRDDPFVAVDSAPPAPLPRAVLDLLATTPDGLWRVAVEGALVLSIAIEAARDIAPWLDHAIELARALETSTREGGPYRSRG
ncbi:hypothetical protein [Sandaracinus amylolyticus]|uniref:Uncharacterized protein n=1 Tax=Sandaracinus amylolyticus TaxID=927083 RepID=A0A0F6W0V9_9BACT|nr:hypothetical protein [Sandaracinus amylolyticus]AKF04650.1 hypothetical protein DB32_001799 [Sandaracinus amylolyticus]